MSLIEQAAKRLEELRRAGADVPDDAAAAPVACGPAASSAPTPEARRARARRAHAARRRTRTTAARRPRAARSHRRPRDRDAAAASNIDLDRLQGARIRHAGRAASRRSPTNFASSSGRSSATRSATAGDRVKNGNLVMVTSALPGEGKTFTAVNLAMSIAMEIDNTVLLVDGDVAHPDAPEPARHRRVARPARPADTRRSRRRATRSCRTNVDKLTILPAGSQPPARDGVAGERADGERSCASSHRATRIASSSSIRRRCSRRPKRACSPRTWGRSSWSSPPTSTTQHAVNQALATIESCEIVLMMLNKARRTDVGTYYGYYADDGASALDVRWPRGYCDARPSVAAARPSLRAARCCAFCSARRSRLCVSAGTLAASGAIAQPEMRRHASRRSAIQRRSGDAHQTMSNLGARRAAAESDLRHADHAGVSRQRKRRAHDA